MTSRYEMPKIDTSKLNLTTEQMILVSRIVNPKTGELRASKPKVLHTVPYKSSFTGETLMGPDPVTGKAAYLWRMVAFTISPIQAHHCMPVMAEFDLPICRDTSAERRELAKEMDALADLVIATVPAKLHYGTASWASALGYR